MAEEKSNFKWNNREKATETAIKLKSDYGITSEEAVKQVLAEYEGVYFVNGGEISEKRFQNFVNRVEKEKKYKKSKPEPVEVTLTQVHIKELLDKGELTELQAVTLDSIFNGLASYEKGRSDITVADITEETGIKVDRIKGAVGHLIKKGYVRTSEVKKGEETFNFIFIMDDKFDLYNEDVKSFHEAMDLEMAEAEEEEIDDDEVTDEDIEAAMADLPK